MLLALTDKGVVKVERISQDSKRVRASAGSSSFHREATLQRRLKEVQDYVEELKRQPDEAASDSARRRAARERGARERQQRLEAALALLPTLQKARQDLHTNKKKRDQPVRVSRTAPEARRMRMGDGGTRPAYSMQLAADPGSGAIVGVEVVDTPADQNQSEPLRQQVERRTKGKVKEHLMHQGYVGIQQIDAAEQAGVAVYAPLPKGKNGRPVTAGRRDGVGTKAWRARMQTEEASAIYKQRLPASERVNAEFQERLGLRSFAVSSLRPLPTPSTAAYNHKPTSRRGSVAGRPGVAAAGRDRFIKGRQVQPLDHPPNRANRMLGRQTLVPTDRLEQNLPAVRPSQARRLAVGR